MPDEGGAVMYDVADSEQTKSMTQDSESDSESKSFEAQAEAAGRRGSGPLAEFAYFLRRSRKWWMTPIIAMLLLVGVLLVMAGTAVGPLIYALF